MTGMSNMDDIASRAAFPHNFTPTAALISHASCAAIDSLSRSTRERLEKAGLYPRAVRLTGGRVAFVRAEVERWVVQRITARDTAVLPQNNRTAAVSSTTNLTA